eukprot:TRINITY_DN38237_c0_g1_i1.p1 TRINITY_DN38237_c0_g1~~TRINITY_DN38237_c0_g1_i1.p1  ORF type:complete len:1101 (+),score=270.61 TRINITY_DN38237_c0_g1_i1:107-3409(+)
MRRKPLAFVPSAPFPARIGEARLLGQEESDDFNFNDEDTPKRWESDSSDPSPEHPLASVPTFCATLPHRDLQSCKMHRPSLRCCISTGSDTKAQKLGISDQDVVPVLASLDGIECQESRTVEELEVDSPCVKTVSLRGSSSRLQEDGTTVEKKRSKKGVVIGHESVVSFTIEQATIEEYQRSSIVAEKAAPASPTSPVRTTTSTGILRNSSSSRRSMSRSGRAWQREVLADIVLSSAFVTASNVLLLVAVLVPDATVVFETSENLPADALLTAALVFFAVEFFAHCLLYPQYRYSFFFFTDIMGNASLVMDISYMLAADCSQPFSVHRQGAETGALFRASRAAKLCARAGRLLRLMKGLKSFLAKELNQGTKDDAAIVLTWKLQAATSARASAMVMAIAILLVTRAGLSFPEWEDSMLVWAQVLNLEVKRLQATRLAGGFPSAAYDRAVESLNHELWRMQGFYEGHSYGPLDVCLRGTDCLPAGLSGVTWQAASSWPARRSLVQALEEEHVTLYVDLSGPMRRDAALSLGMIGFIVFLMLYIVLDMTKAARKSTLLPLRPVLTPVKRTCERIAALATHFTEPPEEEAHEAESELDLYAKAIQKLGVLMKGKLEGPESEEATMSAEDAQLVSGFNGESEGSALQAKALRRTMARETRKTTAKESARRPGSTGADSGTNSLDGTAFTPRGQSGFLPLVDGSEPVRLQSCLEEDEGEGELSAWPAAKDLQDIEDNEGFDFFALGAERLQGYAKTLFQRSEIVAPFALKPEEVQSFVARLRSQYKANPYHNFAHAVDVLHNCHVYLRLIVKHATLDAPTQLALLIAAIGHDAGHPGFDNRYLVETCHMLSLEYNDKSPLENMHCSLLFTTLQAPDANILSKVDRAQYKSIRALIVHSILHTDAMHHNDMVKQLQLVTYMDTKVFEAPTGLDEEDAEFDAESRRLLLADYTELISAALLHCADINNPARPWDLCRRMAYLCLDEFFAQGDLEKKAGLPVGMLNDRDKVNKAASQVGFVEFMVLPFVEALIGILPAFSMFPRHLERNVTEWSGLWLEDEEKKREEQAGGVEVGDLINEAAVLKFFNRARAIGGRCQALTARCAAFA